MPTAITLMSALTFPDEGDPRTFAQRRQATAWLFDAIDLQHPGFVHLALQAGDPVCNGAAAPAGRRLASLSYRP